MNKIRNCIPLLGRILLSIVFILGAVGKVMTYDPAVQMVADAGIPLPVVALVLAFFIEFIGGICLLFGIKARFWGGVLALYVILVTAIFHHDYKNLIQQILLTKNLGIIGGLLFVHYFGAGPLSIDGDDNQIGMIMEEVTEVEVVVD